jgi:hypothetical protein
MPDLGPMSAPEISTVNAVRFRVSLSETRWLEVLELLRAASGDPYYTGPKLAEVERIAAAIAGVR